MYSDRSETSGRIKRSVKDRLGSSNSSPSILTQDHHRSDLKRQRQDDSKLVHDLSGEPDYQFKRVFPENSSAKVLQDNIPRSSKNGSLRETQGNLLETPKTQQVNVGRSGVPGTKGDSGAELASAKKPVMNSASTPSTGGQKKQDVAVLTVASFLQRLGLSKYAITFQAEEVDMLALKLMNDNDLKALGLPMGPRKKILLGLARTKASK